MSNNQLNNSDSDNIIDNSLENAMVNLSSKVIKSFNVKRLRTPNRVKTKTKLPKHNESNSSVQKIPAKFVRKKSSQNCKSPIKNGLHYNEISDIGKYFNDTEFERSERKNNLNIIFNDTGIRPHIESDKKFPENARSFTLNNSKQLPNRLSFTNRSTNRSLLKDSPLSISQEINSLAYWGVPESVLTKYHERGVRSMFPWQVECLSNIRVLQEGANLVYSAPTSAGKTLVAEMLALKTVFERKKKVLMILPFVSVVREKMFYFRDIFGKSGVRVEGFMGSYSPPGGFQKVHVAICTIEKANSLINKLLEEDALEDIGTIVVDELHLLGDYSRGYILELLLTKICYMASKKDNIKIQIIGMSATLPNLSLLAKWLKAELYKTDFRPVPLSELCHISGHIYDNSFNSVRKIHPHLDLPNDSDNVVQLCLETICLSCSVLIFCTTKNWCENLAQQIAAVFKKLGHSNSDFGISLRKELNSEGIKELLEQLKRCPVGLDTVLGSTISFGVAFHHAGLTMDERDIIEGAFRNSTLRVLIATSTLSSGVNLPARRVIIRSPMFAGQPIDSLTYRQMIGRAGRMGKDTAGESILICQKQDEKIAKRLMLADLKPISSCLEGSGKIKRAILEVIASGVASTPQDIELFTNCTLLAASEDLKELENPIASVVDFLEKNEFIRLQRSDDGELRYVATSLAKACLSSSLPPEEGLNLFAELQKARQCFVLESELHVIYLVTPYSACNQWGSLDWMSFYNVWENLPSCDRRVGELVGVSESFIMRSMTGKTNAKTQKMYHQLQIHRRFYIALALSELVQEVPLANVADKFQCSRGLLQSLQQSAATFAGMVTSFSRQLGWSGIEILISQFQDRLQFGIHRELLDLMRLPSLNGPRARALFNAGIETVIQLASVDVCSLENALHAAVPFQSEKEREDECSYETEKRNKLRTIWITGKQGLTEREAAEMLIAEARRHLQFEMGLAEAKWETNSSSQNTTGANVTLEKVDSIDGSFLSAQKTTPEKTLLSTEGEQKVESSLILKTNFQHASQEINVSTQKVKSLVKISCIVEENGGSISDNDRTVNDELISQNFVETSSEKQKNKENNSVIASRTRSKSSSKLNDKTFIKKDFITARELLLSESDFLTPQKSIGELINSKSGCKTKSVQNHSTPTNSPNVGNSFSKTTPKNSSVLNLSARLSGYNWSDLSENWSPNDNEKNISNENLNQSRKRRSNGSIKPEYSATKKNKSSSLLDVSNKSDSIFGESIIIDSDLNDILDKPIVSNRTDLKSPLTENINSTNSQIKKTISNLESSSYVDNSFMEKAFLSSFCLKESDDIANLNNKILTSKLKSPVDDADYIIAASQVTTPLRSISKREKNKSRKTIDIVPKHTDENVKKKSERKISVGKSLPRLLRNCSRKSSKTLLNDNIQDKVDNCEADSQEKLSQCIVGMSFLEKKDDTIGLDLSNIDIIDVCGDRKLYNLCKNYLMKQNEMSLSIGCSKIESFQRPIGLNVIKTKCVQKKETTVKNFIYEQYILEGISVCCGKNIVYYFNLQEKKPVESAEVITMLKGLFTKKCLKIKLFDSKEQYKILYNCTGIKFDCYLEDPKIADWLMQPEEKEKNLHAMALQYVPESVGLAQLAGNVKGTGSIGLNIDSDKPSRIRSSAEAVVTWHTVQILKEVLVEQDVKLLKTFETEMACVACLANMELIGIALNRETLQNLHTVFEERIKTTEREGYALAGRRFSFTSSSDIAKVVGIYKGRKISTNRQVLEKCDNAISSLILSWRRLNSTLTKTISPLLQSLESDSRIHGCYITHTSTGRISMHEPNLQNVPKDFEIKAVGDLDAILISPRDAFVASKGCVLLSADYCQLELRLLAHFSKEKTLCSIMKTKEDVFKSIAARWNDVSESDVTDVMRQRTKQLCYGIIYGMGAKVLADHLQVTELEAHEFMSSFKETYPAIGIYGQDVIEQCRKNGFVETLNGRRRYLPNINHEKSLLKSQAERQAVNTVIQGSAADIAKTAMVQLEVEFDRKYPSRKFNVADFNCEKNIVNPVLHLHDEFFYEVSTRELTTVAKIVKKNMEQSVKLSIPFPVKLKSGNSWGSLKEFQL